MSEKKQPDFCYILNDWETTYPFEDRDLITDDILGGDVVEVGTLYAGPTMWAAKVPVAFDDQGDPEDWETQWFDTKEAAVAAAERKPETV